MYLPALYLQLRPKGGKEPCNQYSNQQMKKPFQTVFL